MGATCFLQKKVKPQEPTGRDYADKSWLTDDALANADALDAAGFAGGVLLLAVICSVAWVVA